MRKRQEPRGFLPGKLDSAGSCLKAAGQVHAPDMNNFDAAGSKTNWGNDG